MALAPAVTSVILSFGYHQTCLLCLKSKNQLNLGLQLNYAVRVGDKC